MRSVKSTRFASPVSESWYAWCGELVLERAPLGDVARRDDDAGDVRVVEEVVEDAFEPDDGPVLPPQREVARHRRARVGAHVGEEPLEPLDLAARRAGPPSFVPTSSSSPYPSTRSTEGVW